MAEKYVESGTAQTPQLWQKAGGMAAKAPPFSPARRDWGLPAIFCPRLFLRISVHEEEKRQKIFSSTKFSFKFPIYV